MTNAEAIYDPEADAIAVRFRPEGAQYAESEEVAPGVILDFDAKGNVIGVELLYIRELLAKGSLAEPGKETAKEKPAAE